MARERRGMKQEELAQMASTPSMPISQASISALEKRDSETTAYLFAFARALRINPEWLQTGEGDSGLDRDAWHHPDAISETERARVLELSFQLHAAISAMLGRARPAQAPEEDRPFLQARDTHLRRPVSNDIGKKLQRKR